MRRAMGRAMNRAMARPYNDIALLLSSNMYGSGAMV